jgi:hypothetical protein
MANVENIMTFIVTWFGRIYHILLYSLDLGVFW